MRAVVLALALALVACGKTQGTTTSTGTKPLIRPACKTELVKIPLPADWKMHSLVGETPGTVVDTESADHYVTEIKDGHIDDFDLHWTQGITRPVGSAVTVSQSACRGASIEVYEYWNSGSVRLRRRGEVFVVSAGSEAYETPLGAFRRDESR